MKDTLVSIFFAVMLIYFTVKHDWSKHPKLKSWFPYFLFTGLVLYIINSLLLTIGIDTIAAFKEKKVLEAWFSKFGS